MVQRGEGVVKKSEGEKKYTRKKIGRTMSAVSRRESREQ